MKKIRQTAICISLALLFLGNPFLTGAVPGTPSSQTASEKEPSLSIQPSPRGKTDIVMDKSKIYLELSEETTTLKADYFLLNPTEKSDKLTMSLPAELLLIDDGAEATNDDTPSNDAEPLPPITIEISDSEQDIDFRYNEDDNTYLWTIAFEPLETLELHIEYQTKNSVNENGLTVVGLTNPPDTGFKSAAGFSSSVTVGFTEPEVNPGNIVSLEPEDYTIDGDYFYWTWDVPEDLCDLVLCLNIINEKATWTEELTTAEKTLLSAYIEAGNYRQAAAVFARRCELVPKEKKEALRIGEAYYLEKAREEDKANTVWEELYFYETTTPRAYWALGKAAVGQVTKLSKYYTRVKELQVHPLIQEWLAAQLPEEKFEYSTPVFHSTLAEHEKGTAGLNLQTTVVDSDGDIKEITLDYYWEERNVASIPLPVTPFKYKHNPSCFIEAEGPLLRIYYEFFVVDKSGNQSSSGKKEAFYITDEITGHTENLSGANLVLADYSAEDQDEIRKWFKSYLQMLNESDFISLHGGTPYFIFLGKRHDYIDEYQGPLFLLYSPPPFSPAMVKNQVHGHFLSHLFGLGWNNLPEKQLSELGDSLLLGKGKHVLTLKYLQAKNPDDFNTLLYNVGLGMKWEEAIKDLYGLNTIQLWLLSCWHACRSMIIAIILIIAFAWLGKNGHLVRFIRALQKE